MDTEWTPLQAAEHYTRRGYAVIPVHGVKTLDDGRVICRCGDGATCESPGKHAVEHGWQTTEYRTSADLYPWWHPDYTDGRTYNIGIRTGHVSGIVAVDVDPVSGGWATLESLRADGLIADTYKHRTQSGGIHLLYTLPAGLDIPNSAKRLGPGIDIRGERGYIVAPPSAGWRGTYQFIDPEAPTNPPAPGLVTLLGKFAEEKRLGVDVDVIGGDPTFDMAVMPRRLLAILEEITPQGRRSETAHNFIAQAMRAGYTQAQIVTAITPWCMATGKFYESGANRIAQGVSYSWGSLLAERKRFEIPMPDWWSYEAMQAARPGQPPPTEPSPTLPPVVDTYLRVREGHSLASVDWIELWKADFTPRWLVPALFEVGRQYSLYGGPGTGKSLLMFDLCCQLASGRMIIDGQPVPAVDVAYFDRENSPADILLRAKALGYEAEDLQEHFHYFMFPDTPLNLRSGAAEFVRHVVETGAQIAVVDTLARFTEGVKENESEWVTDVFNYAMVPLKERGITFVRIDHTGQDETRGARGTSAKKGDVDGAWLISLDEKTQIIDLVREKTRTGLGPDHVQFQRTREPTSHILRWDGEAPEEKAARKPARPRPTAPQPTSGAWVEYDGTWRPVLQPLDRMRRELVEAMDEMLGSEVAATRRKVEPELRRSGFKCRSAVIQQACTWRNTRIEAWEARNQPREPPGTAIGNQ